MDKADEAPSETHDPAPELVDERDGWRFEEWWRTDECRSCDVEVER